MTLTVRDLIDELKSQDPDAEVRMMQQPHWPFEYSVDGVWLPPKAEAHSGYTCEKSPMYDPNDEGDPYCAGCEADSFAPENAPEAGVVYLVEGTQLAYGTKDAWR